MEDLKALRDLLLYHVEDLEDIMAALKSHHDFAACMLLSPPHTLLLQQCRRHLPMGA